MKHLHQVSHRFWVKLSQVDLKKYRERLDSLELEALLRRALQDFDYEDVEVFHNGQHYGWFVWDWKKREHQQKDLNDFEADDTIEDVRDFVASLTKINLEDYANQPLSEKEKELIPRANEMVMVAEEHGESIPPGIGTVSASMSPQKVRRVLVWAQDHPLFPSMT